MKAMRTTSLGRIGRFGRPLVAALVAASLLAACGSSTHVTATTSTKASVSAPSASAQAQAIAKIKANWEAFFSGSTSAATKISLLENGTAFRALIDAQAATALGHSAAAKVTSVKLTSSTQATVTYEVLLSGTVALPHATGTALLVNGTWKVSDTAFCALLSLQGTRAPACAS